MFMRFHGGGIGHKATQDWDEFLQRKGHRHDEAKSNDSDSNEDVDNLDLEAEDNDIELEVDKEHDGKGDEDEDRVIADNGEELGDNVLVQEGYGAL
jgi:hypothetical protein